MKFFRNFFKSKFGLGITLAFLGLIAFAFASSDVSNTTFFGGVAGGDRVAVVGDTRITSADLNRSANDALQRVRQQNPTLTLPEFIAGGGLDQVFEQLVSRAALTEYAREIGLRAGDNLVNSEIRRIPAFRGPDGQFSEAVYQQAIAAQGLNDRLVREDLSAGLAAQQLLVPATYGTAVPDALARRYAALFKERRQGAIAFLPSAAFAPTGEPSAAQLTAFYQRNRARFIRPERRVIRYAVFGADAVAERSEPSEAQIAAYYRANAEQFAARETRSFSQVIASSQAQAQAIRQAAAAGQTLAAAARQSGLRTSDIDDVTREQVVNQASTPVAAAYFSAAEGSLTQPARGSLGWHVAQVTNVQRAPGQPLAQARDEISATLREQNRTAALNTLSEEVENSVADGASVAQIAQELGLEVRTTSPVTADGELYGAPGRLDPQVQPAVATAFQMEESEPQLAEVERGETFLIFDVTRIEDSAAAPLNEIREDVVAAWRLSNGLAAARKAADVLAARAGGRATLREAVQASGLTSAQVESVDLTREQLAQAGAQRVPPPLALLFSMAQGTAKKLEGEQGLGYYLVDLQSIEAGGIADDDPLLGQARTSLVPVFAEEYAQQFERAVRTAVGYERNDAGYAAVRQQLSGDN